jgi:hypothetical protein
MLFKPVLNTVEYILPRTNYTRSIPSFEFKKTIQTEQVDIREVDEDGTVLPYGSIFNFGGIGSYGPKAMKKKMITKEIEELGNEMIFLILPEKKYLLKFLDTEKALYHKVEIKKFDFRTEKLEDTFLCFIHKLKVSELFSV